MKILFLTPRFPYPLDGGTNLRNFRLIQSAALEHEVVLLSFLDRPVRPTDLDPVQALGSRVELRPAPSHGRIRRVAALGSHLPDMAYRRWSPRFARALRSLLLEERPDLVQVEGIEMAPYLPLCGGARRVFDDHNVEYLLQRRAYEVDRAAPRRWHRAAYSRVQAERLARFERAACRLADRVVVVSPEDAGALSRLEPRGRYTVVPNAIDTDAYPPRDEHGRPTRPGLLFTGTLDFRPNVDAVEWFLDEIFPRIRAGYPGARAFVVGRSPRRALVARGQRDASIAVTGPVEHLEPYWERASVYVLPMRAGGGVRFKALEAMAAGMPIVSTTLGMEGIAAEPGQHYLAADQAVDFADAVERLLDNPALGDELARRARELVAQYDWRVVAPALLTVYRELG